MLYFLLQSAVSKTINIDDNQTYYSGTIDDDDDIIQIATTQTAFVFFDSIYSVRASYGSFDFDEDYHEYVIYNTNHYIFKRFYQMTNLTFTDFNRGNTTYEIWIVPNERCISSFAFTGGNVYEFYRNTTFTVTNPTCIFSPGKGHKDHVHVQTRGTRFNINGNCTYNEEEEEYLCHHPVYFSIDQGATYQTFYLRVEDHDENPLFDKCDIFSICSYSNSTTQRCPNKIFLLKDYSCTSDMMGARYSFWTVIILGILGIFLALFAGICFCCGFAICGCFATCCYQKSRKKNGRRPTIYDDQESLASVNSEPLAHPGSYGQYDSQTFSPTYQVAYPQAYLQPLSQPESQNQQSLENPQQPVYNSPNDSASPSNQSNPSRPSNPYQNL